jgi:hypothetical protein
VRANRTPGSVRGAPGNRCPYLDISEARRVTLARRSVATGQCLFMPVDPAGPAGTLGPNPMTLALSPGRGAGSKQVYGKPRTFECFAAGCRGVE